MIFLFYISVCYGILRRPMFDYSQECWRHPVCSAEWRVAIPWWKPRRNLRKHCQKRLLFSGRIFLRNFQRSHRSNQSYVGWPYSVSWKKYSTVCADIWPFSWCVRCANKTIMFCWFGFLLTVCKVIDDQNHKSIA